jgi:uncharacterized RDD family membrane protein YckC
VSTNGAAPPAYVGLATRTLAFAGDAALITAVAWTTGAVVALCLSLIGVPGQIKTLIVVDARSGRPLPGRRAFVRVFALVLSALLLCAGFLMILVDSRRRALHDRLVGSLVVDAREPRVVREPGVQTLRRARQADAEPAHETAST